MNSLIVADISIRQDIDGRYCLNDLHRAAVALGSNDRSKEPGKFFASPQTTALVVELTDTQNLGVAPVNAIKGGLTQGTYVCKELVYAYAMWISPSFNLKVIRAYDAVVTRPPLDPMKVLNDPATMRGLLLSYSEKVMSLESKVSEQAPKVAALDRIADAEGLMNPTVAAKALQIPPKKLFDYLREKRWIYRRPGGSGNVAYQDKIQDGYLTHKVTTVQREDGTDKVVEQVLVTGKGLAKLSQAFGSAA